MTGPEHYKMAEELLAEAEKTNAYFNTDHGRRPNPEYDALIARAQVHATLAQAAASVASAVFGTPERGYIGGAGGWRDVLDIDRRPLRSKPV